MSWQYYDEKHHWGMEVHTDTGPIVWSANGYTRGGVKSSRGVRHPHGFADSDREFLWVFYQDTSNDGRDVQPGIKVERARIASGDLPRNWQTYCDEAWVNSLPDGFDVDRMSDFYPKPGGCASNILPAGGEQISFAVAEKEQGGYIGVEERVDEDGVWELRLWSSRDLVHWFHPQTLLSRLRGWSDGELHYPVFLSSDGWHSERVDAEHFYILGTRGGTVRAMRVYHIRAMLKTLSLRELVSTARGKNRALHLVSMQNGR
jgi:hypothetical protein